MNTIKLINVATIKLYTKSPKYLYQNLNPIIYYIAYYPVAFSADILYASNDITI